MAQRRLRDALLQISEQLGAWIDAGQREGAIDAQLPRQAVLYTLYARACDPVVGFLKATGEHSDEQIVDLVLSTCFNGLRAR